MSSLPTPLPTPPDPRPRCREPILGLPIVYQDLVPDVSNVVFLIARNAPLQLLRHGQNPRIVRLIFDDSHDSTPEPPQLRLVEGMQTFSDLPVGLWRKRNFLRHFPDHC